MNYTKQHLTEIGEGGGRAVFILNSRRVLKVAYDVPGQAQNGAELAIWREAGPQAKQVLPEVVRWQGWPRLVHQPEWLISELVNSFQSDAQFEQAIGMSVDDLADFVTDAEAYSQTLEDWINDYPNAPPEFLKGLWAVVQLHDISTEDIVYYQFGKTVDGRIVLLDSGGTNDVIDEFYE